MYSPSIASQDESGAYFPRPCLSCQCMERLPMLSTFLPNRSSRTTILVFKTAIYRSGCTTPDSSILLDLDAPACTRLTSRAFSPHEVIPLIEAIFTNQNEVKMIGYLRGDDAQTFIDVIHEVRLYATLFTRRSLIPVQPSPSPIRPWISVISHHGSGESA